MTGTPVEDESSYREFIKLPFHNLFIFYGGKVHTFAALLVWQLLPSVEYLLDPRNKCDKCFKIDTHIYYQGKIKLL